MSLVRVSPLVTKESRYYIYLFNGAGIDVSTPSGDV